MEEEKYTSIQSYVSSLKSLITSQELSMKNRDWTVLAEDRKLKRSYYNTELKIIENVMLHAKAITDIAVENNSTDSSIFQKWIKVLLSFYTTHENRVDSYMRNESLEDKVDDVDFQAELDFQQTITSGRSSFKVKYDSLKKNLDEVRKDEVALRWRGNASVPLSMKNVIYEKHPEIKEFVKNKMTSK